VVVLAAVAVALPRWGLYGAVWITSVCMALNRGVAVCMLASRELGIHPLRYALRIYGPPLANCAVVMAWLWTVRSYWLPGRNWGELIAAALLMLAPYAALTWRFSVAEEHRTAVLARVRQVLG
jgi:hypothetical protein